MCIRRYVVAGNTLCPITLSGDLNKKLSFLSAHLTFRMFWELNASMLKTTNFYIQLTAVLVKKKEKKKSICL